MFSFRDNVPDLNVDRLLHSGATGFRAVVQASDLDGVVLSYNTALTQTYIVITVGSALSLLAALAMPWNSIKRLKKRQK